MPSIITSLQYFNSLKPKQYACMIHFHAVVKDMQKQGLKNIDLRLSHKPSMEMVQFPLTTSAGT